MNKKEREILISIIKDIDESDDKIDVIERLFWEVKKMLKAE